MNKVIPKYNKQGAKIHIFFQIYKFYGHKVEKLYILLIANYILNK